MIRKLRPARARADHTSPVDLRHLILVGAWEAPAAARARLGPATSGAVSMISGRIAPTWGLSLALRPKSRHYSLMVLVRDIMSREVLKISESATVAELTSILTRHRITVLPVLYTKCKLVGGASDSYVSDRRATPARHTITPDPL